MFAIKPYLKHTVLWVLAPASGIYALIVGWFWFHQDDLIFTPHVGPVNPPSESLRLSSEDIELQSSDGVKLKARVIRPPPLPGDQKAGWVLYFHAAGGNIGTEGYNKAWAKFNRLGLGVFAPDYRGYGESEGRPSESGLYRDAQAAYRYLHHTLEVPSQRILLYGYSLGSAVAVEMATRVAAAGLVIEGAFLSIPTRGAEMYPFLPVRWLARHQFASEKKIAGITGPKLLVHAREDTTIPIAHSLRLFELAQHPKQFLSVAGDHTSAYDVDPTFFSTLARFVVELGLPVTPYGERLGRQPKSERGAPNDRQ